MSEFCRLRRNEGYGACDDEAQGNSIWGLPTLQCDVLYLSLEDTQRRIKEAIRRGETPGQERCG